MKTLIFLMAIFAFLSRGRGRLAPIGSYAGDFSDLEFPEFPEFPELPDFPDFPEFPELAAFPHAREDCAEGACSLYAEKRITVPEKVVEHRQLLPRLESLSASESFGQRRSSICGCTGQNEVVDLGEGHYPKYMTIAVCKKAKTSAKSNKFYQCQDYKYMFNVLVKRGVSSIVKNAGEVVELRLPESLNGSWQLFAVPVTVACIAVERS